MINNRSLYDIFKKRSSNRFFKKEKKIPREKILSIIKNANYAPNSCNLQHFSFILIDNKKLIKKLASKSTEKINWSPMTLVAINDTRFSKKRNAGVQSIAASVENILLSFEENKIGACWIAGFKNDNFIKDILKIPKYYEVTGLIIIGYKQNRSVTAYRPYKRNESELLHFNSYDSNKKNINPSLFLHKWKFKELIEYKNRIGSVYIPRQKLNVYTSHISDSTANIFLNFIKKNSLNKSRVKILDVATYEGMFVRNIEKKLKTEIYISEFSDYYLSFYKKIYNKIKTVKMNQEYKLASNKKLKFNIISFVFKMEFLPNIKKMLSEMHKITHQNGYMYITSLTIFNFRCLFYLLQLLIPKSNVYETNKLYQFGPYRYFTKYGIEKLIKESNWEILEKGVDGKFFNKFNWWILKKK